MLNYLRFYRLKASTTARILVFFVTIFTSYNVDARHIIRLDKSSTIAIEEREAIVILTGFGSLYHSAKNQVKNFKDQGFDLFIPDYIDRQSLVECSSNLEKFIEKNKLKSYKKVHVFAYIIGGWTLNTYLANHEWKNLTSVVYDRSSLQETLPGILSRDNPFFSRVLFGPLIKNLAETPYFSAEIPTAKFGLMLLRLISRMLIFSIRIKVTMICIQRLNIQLRQLSNFLEQGNSAPTCHEKQLIVIHLKPIKRSESENETHTPVYHCNAIFVVVGILLGK